MDWFLYGNGLRHEELSNILKFRSIDPEAFYEKRCSQKLPKFLRKTSVP